MKKKKFKMVFNFQHKSYFFKINTIKNSFVYLNLFKMTIVPYVKWMRSAKIRKKIVELKM